LSAGDKYPTNLGLCTYLVIVIVIAIVLIYHLGLFHDYCYTQLCVSPLHWSMYVLSVIVISHVLSIGFIVYRLHSNDEQIDAGEK
jgi:hypothetical protein